MSIASEIQNYANGLGDAYDAVYDMGGIIPQDRNMNNLDTSIRTIPQNLGPTYTAGNGIVIDVNNEISIDDTVVAELSDLPTRTSDLINDGSDNTSTYVEAGDLATVATSGDYDDLLNKPTIPAAQVNSDWDAASGVAQILNKPSLAAVATSGNYSDLSGTPSLATVATSGDYGDLLNKPTIPTVNDATLTITQNGTTAGTFTANSNTSTTVALTDTTYSDFTGATSLQAGTAGLVPAPTTADPDKFLKGDGTWGTPTDTTYSAGTNVQISAGNVISATDTTYSAFTGATSGAAGTAGLVPAPAAGDQNKVLKGDGTWADDSTELVEMSYGESNAWAKFIAAYNAGSIVYCRASSNANPASGAQTRKAFMAYVNNETNPTSVEFQYVRSVSSKTDSQQCDQVFVYTLTNAGGGTWSVASRNMAPKVAVDASLTKTFTTGANATVTLKANNMTGATSSADGAAGYVTKPLIADRDKFLKGDGTWATPSQPTVNDGTLTIQKNGTTVQTFTANQSGNATANITGPEITMTSTDPGSGSALAADNYVAVYGNSDGQITSSDLASNSVATANLQDYSVTRVKLNHLDLVNNGEWVCIGYAYLGTTTDATTAVTVNIPADYRGGKMQYKIVGAYEIPSINGSEKYPRVEVNTGGTWRTNSCFYSCQRVWKSQWGWYGESGGGGYAGTTGIFGHEWNCASDWDSCTFEFTVSNGYAGSHWTWTGTAGGMSGGHPGTWNGGGRVQDGGDIQAFRLTCSSAIRWGSGAGFAVYVRKRNY